MPSSVQTLQTYLGRITSEHANKPKFVAYVTALIQPFLDSANSMNDMPKGDLRFADQQFTEEQRHDS